MIAAARMGLVYVQIHSTPSFAHSCITQSGDESLDTASYGVHASTKALPRKPPLPPRRSSGGPPFSSFAQLAACMRAEGRGPRTRFFGRDMLVWQFLSAHYSSWEAEQSRTVA
ncbi:hypothetical protein L209DRAFT_390333 [Thermothelomyces heterothallicus CBS 203.75]